MQKVIYVGIGGGIGAIARYLITMKSANLVESNIPIGRLIVKCSWWIFNRYDN